MRTVNDVKEALSYDTMIDVVNNYRKNQQKNMQKPKRKKNRWDNVFPICKNK